MKLGQKLILVVSAIFPLTVIIFGDKQAQDVKIKTVSCNISLSHFYPNYTCYAKSYSRQVSTATINLTLKRPLSDLSVNANLHYKYGMIFREVLRTPTLNWCKFAIQRGDNLLADQLYTVLKDSVPSLLHPCPYSDVNLSNFTVKTMSLISVFPSGDYKLILTANYKGKQIVNVNMVFTFTTSDKETFG